MYAEFSHAEDEGLKEGRLVRWQEKWAPRIRGFMLPNTLRRTGSKTEEETYLESRQAEFFV